MEKYKWALNPAKLQRAIANVKAKVGPKPTEKDIMDLYVSYGGLVDESNMHSIEAEAVKVAEEKKQADEEKRIENEQKKTVKSKKNDTTINEETNSDAEEK